MEPLLRLSPSRSLALISLLSTLFNSSPVALAEPASSNSSHSFLGTGSCSSSNCHGNQAPISGSTVLRNEYVSWQKHDAHSRAYQTLLSQESQIIARHLGISKAEKEPLCLKCHSTYVPEVAQRGPKYSSEDGVSCESCHGSAGGWLKEHTAKDATHAGNIKAGLRELSTVNARSKLCLSCHFGDESKTVNHKLLAAGHPRLSFEQDTYEATLPRHWEIDADYLSRKNLNQTDTATEWFSAQVQRALEEARRLSSDERAMHGLFPEFSTLNCYTCHHSLKEDQWKSRNYGKALGLPLLNLSSTRIVLEALKVTNPKRSNLLATAITELENIYLNPGENAAERRKEKARKLENTLDTILNSAEEITELESPKIIEALRKYGESHKYLSYEAAEQVAMSLGTLSEEKLRNLDQLFDSLKDEEVFRPESFSKAISKIK